MHSLHEPSCRGLCSHVIDSNMERKRQTSNNKLFHQSHHIFNFLPYFDAFTHSSILFWMTASSLLFSFAVLLVPLDFVIKVRCPVDSAFSAYSSANFVKLCQFRDVVFLVPVLWFPPQRIFASSVLNSSTRNSQFFFLESKAFRICSVTKPPSIFFTSVIYFFWGVDFY